MVELLNLPLPGFVEGHSLAPWLSDPARPREMPAVVTYPKGNHSVVHEHWNDIHYQDGSEELFDHRSDPNEHRNLAEDPAHAPVKQALARWIPSTPAQSKPEEDTP